MEAQREAGLLHVGGGDQKSDHRVAEKPGDKVTLSEAGIDKNLADRARSLPPVRQKQFNHIVGEWRERVEQENERGQLSEGRPAKTVEANDSFPRVTLADAGIDRDLSSRAQKLAAVPRVPKIVRVGYELAQMLDPWQ